MISAEILSDKKGFNKANKIFGEIFNKEYKYIEKDIYNVDDRQIFHALVYEGITRDEPIAAGGLVIKNNIATIDWVAVKEEYRRNRYGDMVTRMLVEKAKSMSCYDINADVPSNLISMFHNIGFLPVEEKLSTNKSKILDRNLKMRYNINHVNPCQKK